MVGKDIRFSSWVISLTSIMYGIFSILIALNMDKDGLSQTSAYEYTYYILYFMLIVFGITKIVGLITADKVLRKISIVALMFVWGFVWTSALIEFISSGPNRGVVLALPIIAICGYIAIRGDYH